MADKKRGWLKSEHPEYKANKDLWAQNERRLRGGQDVLDELVPFDWETTKKGGQYEARKKGSTYVNFMDLHGGIITGHMLREAPSPRAGTDGALDFGTLGEVSTIEGGAVSRAHQVYHNVDGRGRKGSQWDPWWMTRLKRAMATGHRWLFMDTPQFEGTPTRRDEINGIRPFIVELSPLSVTQWDEEDEQYNFVIIKLKERRFRLNPRTGELLNEGKLEDVYLLLVRKGYEGLNFESDNFSEGGWWKFDSDGEYITTEGKDETGKVIGTVPVHGTWDSTDGEIPIWQLIAEHDEGTDELPASSRAPLQSLGQVAVSYMNLSSAADYDAWDAGQSQLVIAGITPADHAIVVTQYEAGTKILGVPLVKDHEGKPHVPNVQDGSMGAVSSDVWKARLDNKWEEARILAALEATGSPETSGVSKDMSFRDMMSPRLADYAANLERAQNIAIYYFELFFDSTKTPTGSVLWTREFNLKDVIEDINAIFAAENLVGFRNRQFDAQLLARMAEELGLLTPDQKGTVLAGYQDAAKVADETAAQAAQALANSGVPE